MILPGKAWLQFTVEEVKQDGKSVRRVEQLATFQPKGVGGHLYWGLVSPFHKFVFPTMVKNLVKEAVRKDQQAASHN